ncbi:MAG: histidine kinase [Prolixibacteraceae bacterium]|nr:histidine kinase [Prolixibacteraceae bacterium]
MKKSILTDNKLKILIHLTGWAVILIFPQYIFRLIGVEDTRGLFHFYTNTITYGIIFYVGYLYLVPRLYFRNKKVWYFVATVFLIIALYWILYFVGRSYYIGLSRGPQFQEMMKEMSPESMKPRPFMEAFRIMNFSFTSILISGFALGLSYMDKHRYNEQKRKELEKEKLHSELAFLKNQISPHFFFNTLNNIYSLTTFDTPAAQESILKLSKLMRYLLYDSEHGETMLSNEIDFMNNYIALMKLRINPRVYLEVSFPESYNDISIPPLLFIPFIENAFKHGISYKGKSFIKISMDINQGRLIFITENSIGSDNQPSDSAHSGIGLENVRKRLSLLFPEKHEMLVVQNDNSFIVTLNIEINKS